MVSKPLHVKLLRTWDYMVASINLDCYDCKIWVHTLDFCPTIQGGYVVFGSHST